MITLLRRIKYRHIIPDALLVVISLYASLFVRVSWSDFQHYLPILNHYVPLALVMRIGILVCMGIYDIIWRYFSMRDAVKLAKAIGLSTLMVIAGSYFFEFARIPRSTFFIDTLLVTALLVTIRVARRMVFEHFSTQALKENGRRTLVYGAGVNGRTLAQRLSTDNGLGFNIIGFIDDDSQKIKRVLGGVKVLGSGHSLGDIIGNYRVQELIISTTKLSGEKLRTIVQIARNSKIKARMLTDMSKVREGAGFGFFREIELSDLLNRPQKNVSLSALDDLIRNRAVLITGAGGSIGSELSRQIAKLGPSRLLLLDHSEFNLYQIDQELKTVAAGTDLVVPLLIDLKDANSLRRVMKEYLPEVVFHAAAYKHVHLVENNPYSSILNNLLSTKNLIDVSKEINVDNFVLISSDKAVNPVGIMGATKRVCELMVAYTAKSFGKRYTAVRFGNVLGSSGSLIPLLQKQIENHQPITITHPDMTRYFMLIPEAVSLVLRAATIAKPGDITILKMGEPVKIVEVAKSLLALMKAGEEIPMVFTGLRPGEKMFEELYLCGNELSTDHPDIMVLPHGDTLSVSRQTDADSLNSAVMKIVRLAFEGNPESIFELKLLVQGQLGKKPHSETQGELENIPSTHGARSPIERYFSGALDS